MISENMKTRHDSPSSKGLHIVLACETPGFDGSLKSELEVLGHDVSEVTSTAETMARLSAGTADVLVTDLNMTRSFGLMQICKSLRRDCKRIVATSWGQILNDPDACLYGADFVISSSCNAEDLMSKVDLTKNKS